MALDMLNKSFSFETYGMSKWFFWGVVLQLRFGFMGSVQNAVLYWNF
jgi:hypothetical protein